MENTQIESSQEPVLNSYESGAQFSLTRVSGLSSSSEDVEANSLTDVVDVMAKGFEVDDSSVTPGVSDSAHPEMFFCNKRCRGEGAQSTSTIQKFVLVFASSSVAGNDEHDVRFSPVRSHGHRSQDRVALVATTLLVPSTPQKFRIMSRASQLTTVVDPSGANHNREIDDLAVVSDDKILMNPPKESPNRFGGPVLEEFLQRGEGESDTEGFGASTVSVDV